MRNAPKCVVDMAQSLQYTTSAQTFHSERSFVGEVHAAQVNLLQCSRIKPIEWMPAIHICAFTMVSMSRVVDVVSVP